LEAGLGLSPEKVGGNGVFGAFLATFRPKTKVADRFSADKIGDDRWTVK